MINSNAEYRLNGEMDGFDDDELSLEFQTGVLPSDFPRRLERLKEASGLTWSGFARAVGVDPKQMHRWRKGVEPCGGAMHSLYRFGVRLPNGLAILMSEGYQTSMFKD